MERRKISYALENINRITLQIEHKLQGFEERDWYLCINSPFFGIPIKRIIKHLYIYRFSKLMYISNHEGS